MPLIYSHWTERGTCSPRQRVLLSSSGPLGLNTCLYPLSILSFCGQASTMHIGHPGIQGLVAILANTIICTPSSRKWHVWLRQAVMFDMWKWLWQLVTLGHCEYNSRSLLCSASSLDCGAPWVPTSTLLLQETLVSPKCRAYSKHYHYAGLISTDLAPNGRLCESSSTTTLSSVCTPLETISGCADSSLTCVARRVLPPIDRLHVDLLVLVDLCVKELVFCVTCVLVSVIVVTDMLLTSRSTGHLCHTAVGVGIGNFPGYRSGCCGRSSLTSRSLHLVMDLSFWRLPVMLGPTLRRSGARAMVATTMTEMDVSAVVQTANGCYKTSVSMASNSTERHLKRT